MYKWENSRPPYPNELYHYGVMGMHWGIRRYQPYRKGEHVKGGHFIGQAIAKNRTTHDSYLSSFLASDYQRKVDKLHEETERRRDKMIAAREKNASVRKQMKRNRRFENARAREADNQERADFWKAQAKADIATAKRVNDAFKKDHPNALRKAPATDITSGANRYIKEHTYTTYNQNTGLYETHTPTSPLWNWDRGWGHQWAAEKSQGFDYKKNRRASKANRAANEAGQKAQIYATKSGIAESAGKSAKASKYGEKAKQLYAKNRAESTKAAEKWNNQMIKDGAKYAKARAKLDALQAKGITSGSRYEDALREEKRWQKYLDRKYGTEHHLTSF